MSIQSEVYITKNELFINQAPSFNFELDEDQLLEKALEVGYLTEVGKDRYKVNDTYFTSPPEDHREKEAHR